MIAPPLPATLAPPAPFPLVLSQSLAQEAIAPGIRRGTYALVTSDGPLVVNVVAIDPSVPSVRVAAVLAHDRIVSAGETVSSMARRTGAVAGVNADYFDIGQTNQPLNVVVRDGQLARTPSTRVAFDVRRDRSAHVERMRFDGAVRYGSTTVAVTGVNEWPPQGGATFVTPSAGALRVAPEVRVALLDPLATAGDYRVRATTDGLVPPDATALGFGPAARAIAPPPVAGDVVTIVSHLTPPQDDVVAAVGGGPELVRDGVVVDDPDAPAPQERDVRFPVSGALVTSAATIDFVSVDGRRAASIGVTRPQFAALALALGASAALAFDSGGSATLVARSLGDRDVTVDNAPSDGEERPVADGVFAYSDAPVGPPTALVVRPSPIVALANVAIPVRLVTIDAAGHALASVHLADGDVVVAGVKSGDVIVRAGTSSARVHVDVVPQIVRIDVDASPHRIAAGDLVAFSATGVDARGRRVALGDRVAWSASAGAFEAPGRYRAGAHDARVIARAPGASATFDVRVGRRDVPLASFGDDGGTLLLAYDFTRDARIAYAPLVATTLPGHPIAMRFAVDGDGSGIALRVAFVNALGERRALVLASRVDWIGPRVVRVALPDDLDAPVRFVALYGVRSPGVRGDGGAGSIAVREPIVTIEGTP